MLLRSAPRYRLTAVCALVLTIGLAAQSRRLTLEDIYGPGARFSGSQAATMNWVPSGGPWLDDAHHLWPGDRGTWLRVEAATGVRSSLYEPAQLETALAKAGADSTDARSSAVRRPAIFNRTFDRIAVASGDDLYVYDLTRSSAAKVTASPGVKTEISFSPDGRSLAFVKDNNLYVTEAGAIRERALTRDGSPTRLNGILDWVYSEELYGRGNYRGYWWSPDSSRVAFLQLDETNVPEFTLVDDIPYHPSVERMQYPKAGDPNPMARLGVVSVTGGSTRWIDTSKYRDFLVVNVSWDPDSRSLVYQIQDRQQTWLDLNRGDAASGRTGTLFRDTSPAWVERWADSSADPVWLDDRSFLWLSERNGWRHIYHYGSDGRLIGQVTSGDWEVRRVHGITAEPRRIVFTATARRPVSVDVFAVRLDGSGLDRLTADEGRHRAFFNPSLTLFLDSWSDLTTPPQVRLHSASGARALRMVDSNPIPALAEYSLPTPELHQVKTRDGFVMEALMIKPPGFDPSRRYPVYQYTYAGPHAPIVANAWGGNTYLYHQLLAQQGIIVWLCDNRTASGKGAQSVWPLYRNLGEIELRDIEDGIGWLEQQAFVDGTRIGIAGSSYGGFMTLYALTHSRRFVMGIADGAVSDWRNYDTIYTERYLGLPSENPDGYRRSSPRFSAANLHGALLLVHGAVDDNVHPQNAMQFAYELQRAGKQFQLMIYPRSAHGIGDPDQARHLRRLMLDFTVQNLLR